MQIKLFKMKIPNKEDFEIVVAAMNTYEMAIRDMALEMAKIKEKLTEIEKTLKWIAPIISEMNMT